MNPKVVPPPFEIPDSVELFDFLLEHIPDLIFFKDRYSRFICVNNAMWQRFGADCREEIIGKTDSDILLPEDAERTLKDEQHVLQTGESIMGHISKKVRPDGSIWWALTTKLPLRNSNGEIVGTCGISKDITLLKEAEDALERSNAHLEHTLTELKSAQEQLIAAEKAHSVARLGAGVAHEVRNPLNILNTGLEFFASDKSVISNPTLSMVLEEMRAAIRRADNVVSTLMEGSSPKGLNLAHTDVNAIIDGVIAELSGKLEGSGIKVTKQLAADLPSVQADKLKMKQVLEGLISNASEAMSDGGMLQICTQVQRLTPADITRDPGARGGQLFRAKEQVVTIEVSDTGHGIPEQAIKRVFDPFFTTKVTGSGLGLGLTVCRAIIELHGGGLEIANREDCQGTRVVLKLKNIVQ